MKMILRNRERKTCPYGCCGDTAHGKHKTPTRRRMKRRERQIWKKETIKEVQP